MRKSRYSTIPTPTWPCPYCGYIHYAACFLKDSYEERQQRLSSFQWLQLPEDASIT
jgi:hypothetical protein